MGRSRNTVGTPQKVRRNVTKTAGFQKSLAQLSHPGAKGAQLKIIRGGCAFPKTQLSFEFVLKVLIITPGDVFALELTGGDRQSRIQLVPTL